MLKAREEGAERWLEAGSQQGPCPGFVATEACEQGGVAVRLVFCISHDVGWRVGRAPAGILHLPWWPHCPPFPPRPLSSPKSPRWTGLTPVLPPWPLWPICHQIPIFRPHYLQRRLSHHSSEPSSVSLLSHPPPKWHLPPIRPPCTFPSLNRPS